MSELCYLSANHDVVRYVFLVLKQFKGSLSKKNSNEWILIKHWSECIYLVGLTKSLIDISLI